MHDWTPDEKDAWHLLQLAESGRGMEPFAQFMASLIISGDLSPYEQLVEWNKLIERVRELLDSDGEIWTHLLPGGGSSSTLEHPDTRRMEAVLEGLQQIDDQEAVEYIIGFLEVDGYLDTGWGENRRREREKADIIGNRVLVNTSFRWSPEINGKEGEIVELRGRASDVRGPTQLIGVKLDGIDQIVVLGYNDVKEL